jgi:hypothetical protein
MQFSLLALITLAAATASASPIAPSTDKCGNLDQTRACLFAIDQLGQDVGFTVPIGKNTAGVQQVIGTLRPHFSESS